MGCGASTSKPVQPVDEPESDKILMTESEQNKFNMRVLMLGTGESGKTTVVKQFQRIVSSADIPFQKAEYKQQLRRNVVMAIQTLIQAADEMKITIEDDRLRKISIEVMLLDVSNVHSLLHPDLAQNIYDLWKCAPMQELYQKRRTEFWSTDATPYYLNEVVRIGSADYEPNDDDFLMTRIRSTGVVVSEIIEKPYKFQFLDVGGQRSERRKWIHCFDDVKVIIYMVSLPGYCQVMFEDSRVNIMSESLAVFEDIVKNPIFKSTPIFVFLNKKDIFQELVSSHPISQYFPEYDGALGMAPALDFLKQKFRDVVKEHVPGKAVQFCVVSARDRSDMKASFLDVKSTLKRMNPLRKATDRRAPETTYISTH